MIALPPSTRSKVALGLRAAAAVGRFELQVCRRCGTVQYPPREACHRCLSSALDWRLQEGGGDLLSETTLLHSHDDFFRARLPIRLGLVRLDAGPTAVVFLNDDVASAPARVKVGSRLDRAGQAVLVASPQAGDGAATRGRLLREMCCDPRDRKVLVTDACSALGDELVRSLLDVGAAVVWAGRSPLATMGGELKDLLAANRPVRLVDLDVTSDESVTAAARQIGSQIDILINNAESPPETTPHEGAESVRGEMDINYFGLVRLAQAFGASMRARATAEVPAPAVGTPMMAWVNLLSICALSPIPAQSTFSASKVGAFSFAQSLRAEMAPAGIRVVNVFPGHGDEGSREVLLPKVAPATLAHAMVKALQDGVEDVYPGEVAQDWYTRWHNNPKEVEQTDR